MNILPVRMIVRRIIARCAQAKLKILFYRSYSVTIAAVIALAACANAALAQSSVFILGGEFPVGSGSLGFVASPSVVVADFNRDGNADIVTANDNDGTLTLLLGDGVGHFTQAPGSPIQAAGSTFRLSQRATSTAMAILTWL